MTVHMGYLGGWSNGSIHELVHSPRRAYQQPGC